VCAVTGVPWLSGCEKSFLEELSVKLRREAFAKHEPMTGDDELVILTHGIASRSGAFLSEGSTWGDIILTQLSLRDTTEVRALSYCETAKLSRNNLFEVLHHFPASRKSIQQAALLLAIQRAMLIISVYARLHFKKRRASRTNGTDANVEVVTEDQLKEPHKLLQHVMMDGLKVEEWREIVENPDGTRKVVATLSGQAPSMVKAEVNSLLSDLAEAPPTKHLTLVAQHVVEKQVKTDRVLATMDDKIVAMARNIDKLLARSARPAQDNPMAA
jgi:hypothetical protein